MKKIVYIFKWRIVFNLQTFFYRIKLCSNLNFKSEHDINQLLILFFFFTLFNIFFNSQITEFPKWILNYYYYYYLNIFKRKKHKFDIRGVVTFQNYEFELPNTWKVDEPLSFFVLLNDYKSTTNTCFLFRCVSRTIQFRLGVVTYALADGFVRHGINLWADSINFHYVPDFAISYVKSSFVLLKYVNWILVEL